MTRRTRLFALLLIVLPGCADSPLAPEIEATPGETSESSPRATVPDGLDTSLDDPWITDLLAGLHDRAGAARLDLGLRAARIEAGTGETAAARRVLDETIGLLQGYPRADDPDDAIALAALELVLLDLADTTDPKGDLR